MSWKDKLKKAFSAKDEKSFDEVLEEVREDEPALEIHNHIPSEDETPPEPEDRHTSERHEHQYAESGEPNWFSRHKAETDDRFRAMHDTVRALHDQVGEVLKKWAETEAKEPQHMQPTDDEKAATESNKAILGELEFEAPPGTGDKASKAKDSAFLADSYQQTVSKAEVLMPGISLPTFDSKAAPDKSFKEIDRLRRTALDLAYHKPDTRGLIDAAMAGRPFDAKKMRASDVRTLFNAVAGMQASVNNQRSMDGGVRSPTDGVGISLTKGTIKSIADINRANRERLRGHRSA